MASGFRGLCRLAGVISLRRIAPAVLPQWRYLATASIPASRISTNQIHQSKLRPPIVVPVRGYAEGITSQELTERVLMVLKSFDKIDPTKVALDAHFINDYGLDSLDVVEIVMAFENEFGIEIDDEQAEKIFTANDAIAFLTKEMGVH